MVEMREAPDPTVVLEIALVRLARPELDPSPAALLERLERLERAGGPAPAPAAPPPRAARARPALGELRPASRARPVSLQSEGAAAAPPAPDPPATRTAPTAPSDATSTAPAPMGPDRDALTLAWGDAILGSLSPRARALFQAGRFTAADGRSCTFAVDSPAQREHCERKRAEVEAAIAAHFGTPVALRLTVEDRAVAPAPAPVADDEPDLLAVDLDEMDGGVVADTETIATARVLDAFPGATEVRS